MIVTIKGKEADQHRINVESVIKLFSNFNRFLREVGKKHDIANLEIQIVDIKKSSFAFEIEPVFSAPLFADERKNDFLEDTERILRSFNEENETAIMNDPKEVLYTCAASFSDFNELLKKDYQIAFNIYKKDLSIDTKSDEYIEKYREKYSVKERQILDGIVSGKFIIRNGKISSVENYEYIKLTDENNTIVFNYIHIEDRTFRFKKPITTKIIRNEEGSFEIPFPGIDQSAFGDNEDDAILSFKELTEVLYDEYLSEDDNKLHSSALQLKEYLKKILTEEIREDK